ncbi:MAG: hypothetical protein D6760_08645 [Deltaproteobacteria bacterium]|nr:MAG: hypothetical protein D6760_08645 [Deltaproteobacteria bacterium]
MSLDRLITACVRPLALRRLRVLVTSEVGPKAAASVLSSTRRLERARENELPQEQTVGARVMVRLAALTNAAFDALLEHGFAEPHARRLTVAVAWQVYRVLARPTWWISRLLARDRIRRVHYTMCMLVRFPYAAPGYRMTLLPPSDTEAGFDVHRCPVADYFRSRGRLDLCAQAFCDLDYALARQWGVQLVRPRTLSRGFALCDFRFRPPAGEAGSVPGFSTPTAGK